MKPLKINILKTVSAIFLCISVLSGNAQQPDLMAGLSAYGITDATVETNDDHLLISYTEQLTGNSHINAFDQRVALLLNLVALSRPEIKLVTLRAHFANGQIMDVMGLPEDGVAMVSQSIDGKTFVDRLEYVPRTRGQGLLGVLCTTGSGSNCATEDACDCLEYETCNPEHPNANARGCVVTDKPAHTHIVRGELVCDDGYEWNAAGTKVIKSANCGVGSYSFQGDCHCLPGYERAANGKCVVGGTGQQPETNNAAEKTPKASFSMMPLEPVLGDPIVLVSTSSDPQNLALTYSWRIDGNTVGSDQDYTWTPADAGRFKVELTVTNSKGVSSTESLKVKVKKKDSGCFIATACYGSIHAPEVLVLRNFRDGRLSRSSSGRTAIALYYQLSPPLAQQLANHPQLATAVRYTFVQPIVATVPATPKSIWGWFMAAYLVVLVGLHAKLRAIAFKAVKVASLTGLLLGSAILGFAYLAEDSETYALIAAMGIAALFPAIATSALVTTALYWKKYVGRA